MPMSASNGGYRDWAVLKLTQSDKGPIAADIADGGVFDESRQFPGAH